MKTLASYHQQRMWFVDHFEKDYLYPGGPIYHNLPLLISLESGVNVSQVVNAVAKVVERHDVLRAQIRQEGNEIFQWIIPAEKFDVLQVLCEHRGLIHELQLLRQKPFDFESDFLFKVYYDVGGDYNYMLFIFHHAIIDRASLYLLKEEVLQFVKDPALTLEYTLQYPYFSDWQHRIDEDELEVLRNFWERKLKNLQVLKLPTDHERVLVHVYEAESKSFTIDRNSVLSYCLANSLSAQMLTLASFKLALAIFSGLQDIAIGTLMDVRNDITHSIIGPLENLVVLRTFVDGDKNLLELSKTVSNVWQEAENYKTMPFDKLVGELNPQKDMSRTALFDVLYLFEAYSDDEIPAIPSTEYHNQGMGKYDLNLLVKEANSSFKFILTYNRLYFESSTIDSFLNLMEESLLDVTKENNTLLEGIEIF